jgi:hypothetical protein
MNKLNFKEFQKRVNEVNKAYRIFSPLTNNMTEAFRLYQEVLAEEKMEVFVSTATGNRPMTPIDDFVRPKCPECDIELMLRTNVRDVNEKVWNTSWFCQTCLTDYYSDKTVQEWMQELKKDVQQ